MNFIDVQRYLKEAGFYPGKLDDDYGPATATAIETLFRRDRVIGWQAWPAARRIVAAKQLIAENAGIEVGEIDGLVGPQTLYALEVYDARRKNAGKPVAAVEEWRDKLPAVANTAQPATATRWPLQSGVSKFFGAVGANQTTLIFPYPMRLAWQVKTIVKRTSCHEKVHDASKRVLTRVRDHYGLTRVKQLGLDLFGGCLNVRKMRGGSAYSMHAWGIAWDFDPDHNQLKWNHLKARFAKPEYQKWFELWEEEGFVSLGRVRDFDWMHTQAARL